MPARRYRGRETTATIRDAGRVHFMPTGCNSRTTFVGVVSAALILACSDRPAESPQAKTEGRLDPAVIQATIREHYGAVRRCFELGLVRDPELGGRVLIRFVITESGDVKDATDGGSDVPDAQVVGCIAREFSRLKFPRPDGGRVTVVYPLMLEPG